VRFAAPPVDGDHGDEGDEKEGKRYAKDADRALHGAGNLLWLRGIPIDGVVRSQGKMLNVEW
jgi:hypothetical protein